MEMSDTLNQVVLTAVLACFYIRGSSLRLTFSPEEMVKTNVEKTGRGSRVFGAQHSILAPMGKQNRGTDSDRGKDS